jgi:hypothetical protein
MQTDVLQQLIRYGDLQDDLDMGSFPSMLDQFQAYFQWANFGSNRNPLALYGETSLGKVNSRGGFSGWQVLTNPSGGGTLTATARLACFEPVLLSPCSLGGVQSGFVGLQTFNLTVNIGNLHRMISYDGVNSNAVTCVGAFHTQPALYTVQLTPSAWTPSPRRALYPFNQVTRNYNDAGSAVTPGSSVVLQSGTYTLNAGMLQRMFSCLIVFHSSRLHRAQRVPTSRRSHLYIERHFFRLAKHKSHLARQERIIGQRPARRPVPHCQAQRNQSEL